jgi:Uma2 family endonuclease
MRSSQEKKCGFYVLPNLHVHVTATRYRIPDLSVLSARPETTPVENPPLITIEIVSENEPWPTLRRKVRDHHEMGVRTIIVADPGLHEVFVAQEDGLLRQIAPPLIVSLDAPGAGQLQIDFDDLFAQLG